MWSMPNSACFCQSASQMSDKKKKMEILIWWNYSDNSDEAEQIT